VHREGREGRGRQGRRAPRVPSPGQYPYIDNAPSATVLKYTLPKDQAEPFDMIEVWNKGGFTGGDIEGVLKWTERNFYDRGLFPAVISGMDDHGPEHRRSRFTRSTATAGRIAIAIKARSQGAKTWVSDGPERGGVSSINRRRRERRLFKASQTSKPRSTSRSFQDGKSLGNSVITGDSFSSTVKGSTDTRTRRCTTRTRQPGPLPHHQRRAAQVARVRAHLAG